MAVDNEGNPLSINVQITEKIIKYIDSTYNGNMISTYRGQMKDIDPDSKLFDTLIGQV